jgi:hypothetical protein
MDRVYQICLMLSWRCEFKQPHRYIAAVLPMQTYNMSTCVIMLLSDYSSVCEFTELVCTDIFYAHVYRRKQIFKNFMN